MELRQLGAYRLEALLGRGGMGEVYRAYDTEHDRVVALKVLSEHLAGDAGYRQRFRREAHLAARLSEPHIVPIHRYGEIEGRLFLDMRLVPGRDVAAVLAEQGPMTPARAVSVISQTARALDAAHADGLVHRDVKPSNILLTGHGDDEFVYLVDFGIARSTSDSTATSITQTGAALGSFDYMAPERFLEKPIDRRVDVYALACVLFECLTGRRPFTGDGLATLMFAHLNTEPPVPSQLLRGLPPGLDDVVRRGLAKDPDRRYATCGELAAAARAALTESGVTPQHAPSAPPTTITPMPFPPQPVGYPHPGAPGGFPHVHPAATGGYGPPASPGRPTGYGPPSDPGGPSGYGAPAGYVAPSGYGGPSGHAAPGGYPPGGRRPRRLPLVLGGVAGLVALVVVAVIALRAGGGEPSGPTAAPTTTTTTAATTTTTPAPDPEEDLRAIIPLGFDAQRCTTGTPSNDGELAVLNCGPSTAQPGPQDSAFYLYENVRDLDGVFLADMGRNSVSQLPAGTHCPDAQGYGPWQVEGDRAGRIACYLSPDSVDAFLIWTEDDYNAEAIVGIHGAGQEGLVTLVHWWEVNANSDFGRP